MAESDPLKVFRRYLKADGKPDLGFVTFTPAATRNDATLPSHAVTQSQVVGVIDPEGFMQVEVTSSKDPGWIIQNSGSPIPYLVEEVLSEYRRSHFYILEGPSPADLGKLPALDDPAIITAYPMTETEVTVGTTEPTGAYEIFADTSVVTPITTGAGAYDLTGVPGSALAEELRRRKD